MKREEINSLSQLVKKDKLKTIYEKVNSSFEVKVLSVPTEQTLLVPVKDPISNGEFYAGEVLVTSTIVQVEDTKGWAMVMDTNEELSLYTAVLDACFEANIYKDEIIQTLYEAQENYIKVNNETNQKINSTKVSFDLM